ncbi:MAG TPA: hypothetical protein PLQ04_00105 [Lachnospiraceae bacterium]|nr:hypothetical protein [Lachnospiraceae bacterium]
MEKKKKIRLFILIAVILAFAVILTIWSLPQNRIKRCMDQALVCLNNQQYEQALDLYRSATTIDPYYTDGYLGQIQTCLAIGDNAMLEEYYENALNAIEGISDRRLDKELTNLLWLYSFSIDLYSEEPTKAIRALNRGVLLTHNNEYLVSLLGGNAISMEELLAANSTYYTYLQNILQQQTASIDSSAAVGSFTITEDELLYYTLMANLDYISDADLQLLFDSGRIEKDTDVIYNQYLCVLIALNLSNMNYISSVGLDYDRNLIIDYSSLFYHSQDLTLCEESREAYYTSYETVYQDISSGQLSVSYQSAYANETNTQLVIKQAYGFAPITKKLMIYLTFGMQGNSESVSNAEDLLLSVEEILITEKQTFINNIQLRIDALDS